MPAEGYGKQASHSSAMQRQWCVNYLHWVCLHIDQITMPASSMTFVNTYTHTHKITVYSFCIKSNSLQHWHNSAEVFVEYTIAMPNFEFWILMHSSLLLIRFASFILVPLNKTKHCFSPHSKWQSIIFMAASGWYEILLFISVCFLSLKNWFTRKQETTKLCSFDGVTHLLSSSLPLQNGLMTSSSRLGGESFPFWHQIEIASYPTPCNA